MAEATLEAQLEGLLDQETFSPSSEFASHAVISDPAIHERASRDPEGFWEEQAGALDWTENWDRVLDWSNPPFAKWFVGGRLNVAHNCVARHVEAGRGDRVTLLARRGGRGARRHVCGPAQRRPARRERAEERRIGPGDLVGIYLPMTPREWRHTVDRG